MVRTQSPPKPQRDKAHQPQSPSGAGERKENEQKNDLPNEKNRRLNGKLEPRKGDVD